MTYLMENAPRNSAAGKEFRARLQTLRRTVGFNIAQARKDRKMDFKTLSKRTGIRIRKLEFWEAGRMEITLAGIVRIAAALKVPHSTLLKTRNTAKPALEKDGTPGAIPEDTSAKDANTKEADEPGAKAETGGWHEDLEVEIYRAVKRREENSEGLPDEHTLFAMEEPIYRLMKASVLFCDLACGARAYDPPKSSGLVFLATSMRREAERLYRLFTGIRPDY